MDIKELEIKINKRLNPKLWERWQEKRIGGSISYTLKDEVLNKLREIGKAFIEFLDIPKDAVQLKGKFGNVESFLTDVEAIMKMMEDEEGENNE